MTLRSDDRAHNETVIREHFAKRLAPIYELAEFVSPLFQSWPGRGVKRDTIDEIVAAEGGRAVKTYHGAIHLVLGGYGTQALMLNRSLFEGTIVAHWATLNPETAWSRYTMHRRHSELVWNDKQEMVGWVDPKDLSEVDRAERGELDGLFGEHGQWGWSGKNLFELTCAVQGCWDDPSQLWHYYHIAHYTNNQMLHPTYRSLTEGLKPTGLKYTFDAYPSADNILRALTGAHWSYGQTLSLQLSHFSFPQPVRDEFIRIFDEYFRVRAAEQEEQTE